MQQRQEMGNRAGNEAGTPLGVAVLMVRRIVMDARGYLKTLDEHKLSMGRSVGNQCL